MTEQIIAKMIDFCQGNQQDIAHFLKVYAYARTVARAQFFVYRI